jgi:hypothetical protein
MLFILGHTIITISLIQKEEVILVKKEKSKNYVYEVEVTNNPNDNEEFALELFELMEDSTTTPTHKRINNFDELLDWNEEFDGGEL